MSLSDSLGHATRSQDSIDLAFGQHLDEAADDVSGRGAPGHDDEHREDAEPGIDHRADFTVAHAEDRDGGHVDGVEQAPAGPPIAGDCDCPGEAKESRRRIIVLNEDCIARSVAGATRCSGRGGPVQRVGKHGYLTNLVLRHYNPPAWLVTQRCILLRRAASSRGLGVPVRR